MRVSTGSILLFLNFTFSLVPIFSANGRNSDTPDLNRERRFHNLYKNFNSSPTDLKSWGQVSEGKVETYQINKQDTLWDLSEVLFGDPNFWPKVWSLNSESIENPHQIYPSQTIKFRAGTSQAPPNLEIAKGGVTESTEVPPIEDAPIVEASEGSVLKEKTKLNSKKPQDLDDKSKEILGLAKLPKDVDPAPIGRFPPSIPNWIYGKPKGDIEIEVRAPNRGIESSEEDLKYFIEQEKLTYVGVFVGGELGQQTAADFQYINVQLDNSITDKNLYAISEKNQVVDKVTGKIAQVYRVEGEIEVLDIVNTKKNIYRAMVKKVIHPIEMGAKLFVGKMPRFNVKMQGSQLSSGKAWVIGGEYEGEHPLFHTKSIAYLSGESLEEGATYPIYRRQNMRIPKTLEVQNPRLIGKIKVIKVSDRFATGIVIDSQEEIEVGDVTDVTLLHVE